MVNENYTFPQDEGTDAYPNNEGDPNDAANFGSLVGAVSQVPHIVEGLTFSNVDFSGLSFDVDLGKFYVIADDVPAPNEPVNRDGVGVVNGYTGGTGFTLTDNAVNHVFVSYDPTTNDSPSVTVNDTGTAPSDPSLKIGEIDANENSVSEQWNLIEQDSTLSYPDADAATTALSSLPDGVVVIDRTNGVRMSNGSISVPALEADSYTDAQDNTITDFMELGGRVKYLQSTEPTNATVDETWFDTSVGMFRVYDGEKWRSDTVFRVQEEAVTFDESDLNISETGTTFSNGNGTLNKNGIFGDDFEDGVDSGWGGNTGYLNTTTSTVLSGSQSGVVNPGGNGTAELSSPSVGPTTENLRFKTQISEATSGDFDSVFYLPKDSTDEWLTRIYFTSSKNIRVNDVTEGDIIGSWSAGTTYDIEFDFDFSAMESTIYIDGNNKGSYPFIGDNVTSWDYLGIKHGMSEYQNAADMFIDNVSPETNGTAIIDFTEDKLTNYDAVAYQAEEPSSGSNTSSVTCDVIDGNENVLISDIPENQDTDISGIDSSTNAQLRFDLSRDDPNFEVKVTYAAESYFR